MMECLKETAASGSKIDMYWMNVVELKSALYHKARSTCQSSSRVRRME